MLMARMASPTSEVSRQCSKLVCIAPSRPIHTGRRIHSRNVRVLRLNPAPNQPRETASQGKPECCLVQYHGQSRVSPTPSEPIVGVPSGPNPSAQPRCQCGGHELVRPAGGDYALSMLLKSLPRMPTELARMVLDAYHLTYPSHSPIHTIAVIIPMQPVVLPGQCNYLIHDIGGELRELTDL